MPCHISFYSTRDGGDLQISSVFKCRATGGSRAEEARVGFDFLIVFSTLAVCFSLGAPRFVRKGENAWIICTVLPFISVRKRVKSRLQQKMRHFLLLLSILICA